MLFKRILDRLRQRQRERQLRKREREIDYKVWEQGQAWWGRRGCAGEHFSVEAANFVENDSRN